MNYITIDKFLEDPMKVIRDTLDIEELTRIRAEEGAVIMMTETEFDCLMQIMANRKHIYNYKGTGKAISIKLDEENEVDG